MDVDEIDAFLAEPKRLQGAFPGWKAGVRPDEFESIWLIEDALGIVRAQLRFRFSKLEKAFPSISLVFRNSPIWRIDLVPNDVCKLNPPGADRLGLPAQVCGSHCHSWPDNREYVRINGLGQLPFRRQLPVNLRRVEQVVHWLGERINLTIEPDQRGFDVPPASDLFDLR
jgi:hypothetical protein